MNLHSAENISVKWRQNKNFFRHTNAERIYHQQTHTKTKVLQAEEKWCDMEIQSPQDNAGQMPTGARQEDRDAWGQGAQTA